MTAEIAGLPFWELTFDADGDPDTGHRDTFLAEVRDRGVTDLVVFSHGWNNDRHIAHKLYRGFFGLLAAQLRHVPADRPVTVGLAGVIWPAQRWSDEPIPDFAAAAVAAGGGGAASLTGPGPTVSGASPATLDAATLASLHTMFPAAAGPLDTMARLLGGPPTEEAQVEFHRCLTEFSELAGTAGDDGEGDRAGPDPASGEPRMLLDGHAVLFERYRDTLRASGVPLDAGGTGTAGLGDALRGIWHGAKESLRQATYWQMKNRAGTVGRAGLGPVIGQLHSTAPQVRVHLVGHSFGARTVSFALAGLPDGLQPSPVKGVTLLQGAFSHFAFARPLPFDANRSGALAGMLGRVDGPLVTCFSVHDSAVGTFYPLASIAAREDSAASQSAFFRWGAMGADGAQGVNAKLDAIRLAGPGTAYRFSPGQALNVDASEVVRTGGPPSGAHSDIVHPELTWVVLAAGGIV